MRETVDAYLAIRRAAGFKLEKTAPRLHGFARIAEARGDTHIRVETAIAWAASGRTPHARYRRMLDLVIFAKFVHAEDERHEIPSVTIFPFRVRRRPPHLYTDEEIVAILEAAGRLTPHGSSRPATYQTLFALMAVTGMRVQEALRLTIGDITEAGLVIRETKFRKSRLLPIHATTRAALDRYRERWRSFAGTESPLFVSLRGTACAYPTVEAVFRALLQQLGLRGPAGSLDQPSSGPRLHGLRHTFAVRSLEGCPDEHHAIGRHMTALTTYLGHSTMAATCWYLHASPTLMTVIADACETMDTGGAS